MVAKRDWDMDTILLPAENRKRHLVLHSYVMAYSHVINYSIGHQTDFMVVRLVIYYGVTL